MIINWDPTEEEEILQNVATLLETETGTVPLDRAQGTPQDLIDSPQSIAAALLQSTVIKAIRTYEPRAAVKSVRVTGTVDGTLEAIATLGTP